MQEGTPNQSAPAASSPAYPGDPSGGKRKTPVLVFLGILLLSLVLTSGAYILAKRYTLLPNKLSEFTKSLLSKFPSATRQPQNISIPPASPAPHPIASGRQTYEISGGTQGAPQIRELVVDPIDPQPGASQSMTLKITDVQPIVGVSVTLMTDKKKETHQLTRASGTELDGVWQGTWPVTDSYEYMYQAILTATNAGGKTATVTPTFR